MHIIFIFYRIKLLESYLLMSTKQNNCLFICYVLLLIRTVPDGGYGEDEDCINAEDEEYRAVLERMEADGTSNAYLRHNLFLF